MKRLSFQSSQHTKAWPTVQTGFRPMQWLVAHFTTDKSSFGIRTEFNRNNNNQDVSPISSLVNTHFIILHAETLKPSPHRSPLIISTSLHSE
mmetsp:Transcript_31759/g.75798  ORF Transcript_31759/g.75798 Transcript_31759/m.75798 type:complete len:92 (-) Transcript_31759:484-759(-)